MVRPLIKISLIITLILTITNLIARAIGNTQPFNSAMRGFTEGCEGQPRPCWYGLVPDKTSFDDAVHRIRDYGLPIAKSPSENDYPAAVIKADFIDCEVELFRSDKASSLFGGFYFQNCQTLKLGDILTIMGTPDTVGVSLGCDHNLAEYFVPDSYYWMRYSGIGSVSLNANPNLWRWLSPDDLVLTFNFDGNILPTDLTKTWEGFIPFWRYAQLHTDRIQRFICGP